MLGHRGKKDAAAAYLRSPKRQFRHPVSANIRTSRLVSHRPPPATPGQATARRPGVLVILHKTHSVHAVPRAAPLRASAADSGPRAQLWSCGRAGKAARPACAPRAAGGRRLPPCAWEGRERAGANRQLPSSPPPPARASPAPPPSRNRVPRGHAAGHFAADATCPRSARQEAAVPAEPPKPAWCQGAVGEKDGSRRGESKAHFQALGPLPLSLPPPPPPFPPSASSACALAGSCLASAIARNAIPLVVYSPPL